MNQLPASHERHNPADQENNGLVYGALIGLLLGVIISGPHFQQWPIKDILFACALSSFVTAVLGHFVVVAMSGERRMARAGQPADGVDAVDALQEMDWSDD